MRAIRYNQRNFENGKEKDGKVAIRYACNKI